MLSGAERSLCCEMQRRRVSQERQHGGCQHTLVYLHTWSSVRVPAGLIEELCKSILGDPQSPACEMQCWGTPASLLVQFSPSRFPMKG